MSETGLEEKVENMNVEEKEPKAQKGAKGGDKSKGEKKKKEDPSEFPLEVSSFMRVVRVTPLTLLVEKLVSFLDCI